MKPYERRTANAYPYFKLATWDARNMTWRAGKAIFATEDEARASAKTGRFRVTRVTEAGHEELPPFDAD